MRGRKHVSSQQTRRVFPLVEFAKFPHEDVQGIDNRFVRFRVAIWKRVQRVEEALAIETQDADAEGFVGGGGMELGCYVYGGEEG